MKKLFCIVLSGILVSYGQIELNSALETIKTSTDIIKDGVNTAGEGSNKKENNNKSETENKSEQNTTTKKQNSDTLRTNLKVYQNYDFVAGEKIIFEDHFTGDMDGEFPSHWELKNGQAVLNKMDNELAFFITDGNYGMVKPRMKTEEYLGKEFTLEFDYYHFQSDEDGAYGIIVFLENWEEEGGYLHQNPLYIGPAEISYDGTGGVNLNKNYPEEIANSKFSNKFHHIAIAVKNGQMKVYVDQNRWLVVPDVKTNFRSIAFGGIGNDKAPLIFKNIKLAEGGKMNMLDKISTDGKIVTHGILFDVNRATIKPESMGVINQIYQLMKDNPDLKFEIGGFTDGDGDESSNLKLSEQRAMSVRDQLVSMGIQTSRLTPKGYGESKPIDSNSTPEGKANNRRVEFTKQ